MQYRRYNLAIAIACVFRQLFFPVKEDSFVTEEVNLTYHTDVVIGLGLSLELQ